jgi:uncharacterized protein (TIGR02147 family)
MNTSKDIFIYSDFRTFIKDYYTSQKRILKSFTYRTIAERAGFSSPSFVKHIIDGTRNCTKESIDSLTKALGLTQKSAEYFSAMFFFNQAQNLGEKLHFLKEMDRLRPKDSARQLSKTEFRYLEKWYHPIIREVVELQNGNQSAEAIASRLHPSIKTADVEKALTFLLDNGYLARNTDGHLIKVDPTLKVADAKNDPVMSTIVRRFHQDMLALADRAVGELPLSERNVSNTTLSLSREAYIAAVQRLEQARYEILEIAKADSASDRVYQLSVTLFPLTKEPDLACKKKMSGHSKG